MKPTTTSLVLSLSLLTATGVAQAALVSEDSGQLIYDTALNITWLADANLAATNTFGVSGIQSNGYMTWTTAQNWIGAMDAHKYLGYSDWRLPTTAQPDSTCSIQNSGASYGFNCTGSEMGQLFYTELGGTAGSDITTTNNGDLALFKNVHDDGYWSGTQYVANSLGWAFYFGNGNQAADNESHTKYAWAVLPGNVSAVPLPPAAWLFGSGMLGLVGIARRKRT